jgi:hypothetical protein
VAPPVARDRDRRYVLYRRTPTGDQLISGSVEA